MLQRHLEARLLISSVIAVGFLACGSGEQGDEAPAISRGCDSDGVIDTGEECDEGSNNGQPGYCCSSSCTLVSTGTPCRAANGSCDAVETCDGQSANCPSDSYLGTEIICRPAAGDCDEAERCSGTSISCPTDGYASEHLPATACAPYLCSGSGASCPTSCNDGDDCAAGHTCSGGTCLGSTTGPGTMTIEAEDGAITSPMAPIADASASGGYYVELPQGDPAGANDDDGLASYSVSISQAGDYYLWVRVIASSVSDDSLYVLVDGQTASSAYVWDVHYDVDAAERPTTWGNANWDQVSMRGTGDYGEPQYPVRTIPLSAGSHTITLAGREDGIKVDQIVITNDPDLTYPGPDASISDPPPPASGTVHGVTLPSGHSWERIAHEPTIGLTQSIIDAHANDADSRVKSSYGDAKYSWRRFDVVTTSSEGIAPPPGGGSSVLRHEPHAANSSLYPISYDINLAPSVQASSYSAALFRFGHYSKEYWGASGKFIAACIGRGWGGTAFLKASSSTWGSDGHATYLMHPQTNKTGTTSDNGYGGFTQYYEAYHRNPADLFGDSTNGRSDTWTLNQWNTLDILLEWENGQTGQDSVKIFYNGTQVSSKTGITLPIVTGDHGDMKGFFYRIRMEDELSPEDGQQNKDFTEYWADAELFLAP